MIDDQILQLLRDRFDKQDDRLDKQDKILGQILREARKTNGRVTDHDHRLGALEDADDSEGAAEVARRERRWTKVELFVGGAFILAAGFGPDLIRLLF